MITNVVCILQSAWSSNPEAMKRFCGRLFVPNPRNHSAKVIRQIIGDQRVLYFGNVALEIGTSASDHKKPDVDHAEKVIQEINTRFQEHKLETLVIICGSVAKETVLPRIKAIEAQTVILMPHPASRNFPKTLRREISEFIDTCPMKSLLPVATEFIVPKKKP